MNKNSFVYTNIPSEWLANIESTREKLERKRLESQKNIRGSTSILRSSLEPKAVEKERNAFKRRYKTIPKAGLFAHAVCSSNYRSLDKFEEDFERESHQDSPELKRQRWEVTPEGFRDSDGVEMDFEKEDSPEHKKTSLFMDFDEIEDNLSKRKTDSTPSLQRQTSDAETNSSKIDQLIEHFSRRLDSLTFEPELFIRARIPLGNLETGILNRVLKQKEGKKTIPVADIIEKSSDILLYAEDLKNPKDYTPRDPYFLTDEIISNFDSHLAALEKQQSLNWFGDFEVGDSNKEGDGDGELNFSADLFSASKEEEEEDFFDEKDEESQTDFNIFNIKKCPSTYQWRPQSPVLNIFKDLDDPEDPEPSSSSSSSLPTFKEYFESQKNNEFDFFN